MKKVLLASAALMLVGGIASIASAEAVQPGVTITGDARARLWYDSAEYKNSWGQTTTPTTGFGQQTNMDSRVRFVVKGTTAGGTYVIGRIRLMEQLMGDIDRDLDQTNNQNRKNLWADLAYIGIPFSNNFTLEVGKYRSTYGPLPTTYNLFYDDVNLTGMRGIAKFGNIEINPFVEWMDEAQNSGATASSSANTSATTDLNQDREEIRYGAHVKATIDKNIIVGGMLGYQHDARTRNTTITTPASLTAAGVAVAAKDTTYSAEPNEGAFASLYTNSKFADFGIVAELGYTQNTLNGFNTWAEDTNTDAKNDSIGSKNNGYGGYIFPNYTINKLNLGINAGFTASGFLPDRAFGFVMIGGKDNSIIGDAIKIGDTGDWAWAGFVPSYTFTDSLKLTGNFVYANINPWNYVAGTYNFDTAAMAVGRGEGPAGGLTTGLKSATEVSGILQYTVSKGTDVFFSAGYLQPNFDNPALKEDGAFGAATRLEIKF